MKKLLFIALLLSSTAAMANSAPSAAPAPAMQNAVVAPNMQRQEEKFAERKAKILDRINKHMAEVQQRQACVQAATTADTLKTCFPGRAARMSGPAGEPVQGAVSKP